MSQDDEVHRLKSALSLEDRGDYVVVDEQRHDERKRPERCVVVEEAFSQERPGQQHQHTANGEGQTDYLLEVRQDA